MSDIINILGESLSSLINNPPLSCKGLIRLAIKDAGLIDKMNSNTMNLNDLKNTIEKELKNRLVKLKIDNPDEVVKHLTKDLISNQAILLINI
ncbi:MAG: hypothetical protein GY870_00835 [archaeon]|nr:hypothetical protein [archaeon]